MIRSMNNVDQSTAASLIERSLTTEPTDQNWRPSTFELLIQRLKSDGYPVQARSIELAATSPDGFVSRAAIYRAGAFDDDRSLRRFSVPATRVNWPWLKRGFCLKQRATR